jgi:hypothetical protein
MLRMYRKDISLFCRIRLPTDIDTGDVVVTSPDKYTVDLRDGLAIKKHHFDSVFSGEDSQDDVFMEIIVRFI